MNLNQQLIKEIERIIEKGNDAKVTKRKNDVAVYEVVTKQKAIQLNTQPEMAGSKG